MKIKAGTILSVALVVVLALLAVPMTRQAAAGDPKILEFDTMTGVPLAYTAARNVPIHGRLGGGRPWVISGAYGELHQDGKLELAFSGLVFDPNDPGVIAAGLANRNTVASMKAVVACYGGDGTVKNVETPLFPVTTGLASDGGGSGSVEALLALPSPCIAPVVFITSPGGNWFAATGQ